MGSFAPGQLIPGFLVFSANPDFSIGTFDPGALVQRGAIPEAVDSGVDFPMDTLQLDAAVSAKVVSLAVGGDAIVEEITSARDVPLFDIDHENEACTGFISDAPTTQCSKTGAGWFPA